MHVLVTCDTVGGVWTYTRELVGGLARRGHRVTLVSFGQLPGKDQGSWMQGVRRLEYCPTNFPLEWMQQSAAGISDSIAYLDQLIGRIKPDVLHSSQYCYGELNSSLPRIVVAHSDVLSWWTAVHESCPPNNDFLGYYRNVVAGGLRGADIVVAPSRWMLEAITQHYGLPSHTAVIYNGRDASLFHSSASKLNCVVAAGRVWDEGKQISILLARRHPVPVFIAGDCRHPDLKEVAGTVRSEAANVRFLGAQPEERLRELYAASSMYAATSRYEPFGLAPLEAALSGCALVANDIPVFHELWGESAFYFRRNDPDSLAQAILNFSEDPELWQDFGQRACEHARERFDSERMVSEYENLYREVTCGVAA